MTILVTGGAGFIGVNFIRRWVSLSHEPVINLDNFTYAANKAGLSGLDVTTYAGDIADTALVQRILDTHSPRAIIHLAAETHVDRSISGPENFVQTNVVGTFKLLDCVKNWWQGQNESLKAGFRFLHVSTDEVFGSVDGNFRTPEDTPYHPNSPYSASKAASDHFVRAYRQTYGLPVLTTHCGNNFGPFQYPEKLIPLMIHQALQGKTLPVYGDGQNIRDWIFVDDHCDALCAVLARGRIGESYNIGGGTEIRNIDLVHTLCDILDRLSPKSDGLSYRNQIGFVPDRPGHDRRYAVDDTKIKNELSWSPRMDFAEGLEKTITWYLQSYIQSLEPR